MMRMKKVIKKPWVLAVLFAALLVPVVVLASETVSQVTSLTLQELMVGLTLIGMLVTLVNGWRQKRTHDTATNPAIVAIKEEAIQTRADVRYIREALDARASSEAAINQRIDSVIERQAILEASVKTLQETMKIMQKTMEMQQNMILKIQGRENA